MENVKELISKLDVATSRLQSVVDLFPPDKREDVLFDQWSLKDILAHFSGWNLLTVKELTMLQNGTKVDKWTGVQETEEFNNQSVTERKSYTWDEVYKEFVDSQKMLLQKYKELTRENWNSQFGPSEKDTPIRSIKVDIKHIGLDHLARIEEIASSNFG